LNLNPDNKQILNDFIVAAQQAEKDIEYKYKDFWVNPATKISLAEADKANEEE